ncbi:Protein TONNEAU 1a [Orobanche gracilis]
MDDYTREMMDLKTLVTRTLEKKGVLAKIRVSTTALFYAELRASVFEAIEEEDRVIEKDDGLPPALLGSCNDRAKQLHNSPSGRLLTALICEYLDWAQLNHTLKVYLPECNLPKESWKSELKEFSSKNGYDLNRNGESGPLLLDVLEGFLKYEV